MTLTDDIDLGTKEKVLHVKYKSSVTYHSKVMANVKVFFCRHIEKQTYREAGKWAGQKLCVPDLSKKGVNL